MLRMQLLADLRIRWSWSPLNLLPMHVIVVGKTCGRYMQSKACREVPS